MLADKPILDKNPKIPGARKTFDQCMESMKIQRQDQFQQLLICSGNFDLGSQTRTGALRADHT